MQPDIAVPVGGYRRWWWADALLWTLLASILAPSVFTLSIGVIAMLRGAGVSALGSLLYIGPFAFLGTFLFALVPYAVVLVAWAAVAPSVVVGERSTAQVAGLSAMLALPAGLAGLAWARDADWGLGAWIWGAAWIGLLLPRLLIYRLRPGAFCRSAADIGAT
jgi:hypothetical protein